MFKNRQNKLKFDLSECVTVEFWMKNGGFNNALTKREVIFVDDLADALIFLMKNI